MIKGISKKVIVIKDPQSELFEEAYFIIKTGKGLLRPSGEDMATEANRLLLAYHSSGGEDGSQKRCVDGAWKNPVKLTQPQPIRQPLPGKSYTAAHYVSKKSSSEGWLRALICFAAGMAFTGVVFVLLRYVVFTV